MKDSFCDLGFTKLDTGRKERTGFGEVVFCHGKRNEFLKDIFSRLFEANGEVLGTRATQEQFELVKEILPQATYDSVSRIIKVQGEKKKLIGNIAVCTAGTADIPVAEESAQTAEFFGSYVERILMSAFLESIGCFLRLKNLKRRMSLSRLPEWKARLQALLAAW